MIENQIRQFRDEIEDDDIYDDALRKLQDSLEDIARLNNSIEVTEALQEILLTRQFLRRLVYSDVEERSQEQLRKIAERNQIEEGNVITEDNGEQNEVEISSDFKTILRLLNKTNTQQFFDDDYGYIIEDNVQRQISIELDHSEEVSERVAQFSKLVADVYQKEYDKVDQEYRKIIQELLTRLLNEPDYSQNPYQDIRDIMKKFKLEIHEELYGWPAMENGFILSEDT